MGLRLAADPDEGLSALLRGYSTEVIPRDRKALETAADLLPRGAEVFIPAVRGESPERLIAAAARLRASGLTPVPHVVARSFAGLDDADRFLARLRDEAGVDRVLALGGDRDAPAGVLRSSQQLIESGLFPKRGILGLFIACYPERHPRIPDDVLERARAAKLRLAADQGLEVELVSQFCFDAAPIIALARRLGAPYRVGVAGPAERATLVHYGLMCGIGRSLRALTQRRTRSLLTAETPNAVLAEVAAARRIDPALNITGVHLFTFGGLARSVEWAAGLRR